MKGFFFFFIMLSTHLLFKLNAAWLVCTWWWMSRLQLPFDCERFPPPPWCVERSSAGSHSWSRRKYVFSRPGRNSFRSSSAPCPGRKTRKLCLFEYNFIGTLRRLQHQESHDRSNDAIFIFWLLQNSFYFLY